MRRWPWLLVGLVLAVGAVALYPRVEAFTAQSESSGAPAAEPARPFPLATILLAGSAGVCLAAGFRPQSRAVQRGLDRDDPDPSRGGLHQTSYDVLARLRRR